ncbi:MAG TPA: secondary thiamine-phosphate synthase enzyme YjbQ [Anaerolineales bacterium]|jgi:secondary thiamine-phosphate synthase enzyme|nr:secondary thiamine-phosphate synthase enzyme YjbQ [Anaerolineales bacterium]
MTIKTHTINLNTQGNADIQDITNHISQVVVDSGLESGTVTVFTPSATSGLTTIEFESGCISDLRRLFDEIIDPQRHYAHNARWGDGNGHSHVRAALLGPSLCIPFVSRRLTLGTWQQVIFVDFDNRQRHRELVAQIIGE